MNTAWSHATIAFQPYPDVGEFVNVGVLAVAAPARVLAYRLLPAHTTARIHAFFPELNLRIYKEGRKRIEAELKRIEESVNTAKGEGLERIVPGPRQSPLFLGEGDAGSLFKALTAPRDGLFRFHAKGSRLALDSENILDVLFERYVIRATAEVEDPEEIRLVHEVSRLLDQWKLRRLYRKDVCVGTDAFHVRFPFGYQPDEDRLPARVIKPLNLAQANSTQIYHHGDMWVANLSRLKKLKALPERVFLPVKMPLANRGANRDAVHAAEEINEQLSKFRVATVAEAGDRQALRKFAEIPMDNDLVLKS